MRTSGSKFSVVFGAAFAAVIFAACGGDNGGGGGSCGMVQPCGGSVVGTWTIQSSCQSVEDFTYGQECPGATLDESAKVTTGTLTFGADMSFAATGSTSGTMKVKVPLSCANAATCDDYAALVVSPEPGAPTTCTTIGGDTCDCSLTFSTPQTSSTGTYTTSGDTIVITQPGVDPEESVYCVQGNTLHVIRIDGPTGEVRGGVVATR